MLSDVSGVTGQAIIKAILGGQRNAHKLAEFRDPRVKASEEQIARSLEGHWQEDLLFVLQQEQDGYEFCRKQMAECDRQLNHYLEQSEDRSQGAPLAEEKRKGRLKKKKGNAPQFDLREGLFRLTGTHLTRIDSIDVLTATTIVSEAGYDMSKWETENHFVSTRRSTGSYRSSTSSGKPQPWIPTHPSSSGLKSASFWESLEAISKLPFGPSKSLIRKMPNEVLNCILVYCFSFPFPWFFRSWVSCYQLPDAVFCLPSHMAMNPSGARSGCRNFLGAPAVRSRASAAR